MPEPVHPLAYRVRGAGGVCAQTGYSPAFVYKQIETGRLPAVRVGRTVTVLHVDLDAFLKAHREAGDAA